MLRLPLLFLLLGVFKLLAYSHSHSGSYKPRQISVECFVWEGCHIDILFFADCTGGDWCTENFRHLFRVLTVDFVCVAGAEKQQGVGVFLFHAVELTHYGELPRLFFS